MSDLFEEPETGGNAHEFTVSEISGAVKKTIEGSFGHVRVRGEVGRTMLARTGHLYFDLKDDRSVIASVSWKGQVAKLAHMPEEGMEVIVTGRMTTYGPQSKYQLNVEAVEPAGEGALMAMLEKRKKKLEAEGLFSVDLKKPLPYLPDVIGVVTSPTGAVIRDILHRLRERFPRKVLIWPVAVQGKNSAPEVARAIAGFNALVPGGSLPRPDLLIVARGGGSVEDLWGFNEEIVARAAAASDIPLISAVGHETDTTLIDYVSDVRAPTPTAAAELAVPVRHELLAWTQEQDARLGRALTQGLTHRAQRLRDVSRALPNPAALLETPQQRFDRASERLPAALQQVVQRQRLKLSEVAASVRVESVERRLREAKSRYSDRAIRLRPGLLRRDLDRKSVALDGVMARFSTVARVRVDRESRRLDALDRMRQSLGYIETLKRGYAVVRGNQGVVTTAAAAAKTDELEIEFSDARINVRATVGSSPTPPTKTAQAPPKKKSSSQGSLF